MSNFTCEHCGTDILEGQGGRYVTGCKHYPLDNSARCDKISAMLYDIHCECGKKIGRGRGVFELPCRFARNHNGVHVLVLGEAGADGTKVFNVRAMKDSGVSAEMMP